MAVQPLGRVTPPDFVHVEKYPLSALGPEAPVVVPVVLGVNWYTSFDNPIGMATNDPHPGSTSWHLPDAGKPGVDLGTVRGGHAFVLEPMGAVKLNREAWRVFYNQKREGACEGFSHARAQSIIRGILFDGFDLYDRARAFEHNLGEGSTNRSTCAVLQSEGLRPQHSNVECERGINDDPLDKKYGINAYRWATTADEVCAALGRPGAQAVPFQNNWGVDYPDVCWMPVATLDRLLKEEGEADVVTDR